MRSWGTRIMRAVTTAATANIVSGWFGSSFAHATPSSAFILFPRFASTGAAGVTRSIPPKRLLLNRLSKHTINTNISRTGFGRRHERGASWAVAREFVSKKRPRAAFLSCAAPEASHDPTPAARGEHPTAPDKPPWQEAHHYDPIAQATLRWVRSTVVGLNLCPWAAGAVVGGHMQVVVHPPRYSNNESARGGGPSAKNLECGAAPAPAGLSTRFVDGELQGLVEVAAVQAAALGALEGEAAVNATTLVVARPPLAADFAGFLAVAEAVDDFIDGTGLRGTVQLATFHPQYQFEGSEEEDASNFTNRSPYPVLHLLLESQVEAAVSQIGDPARVWKRNVETTRGIGAEAMRLRVEACMTPPKIGGKPRTEER